MKPGTIYVDATDFLSWTGHFTGIQRTFYSIVEQLEKKHSNLRLVVFFDGKYQVLNQSIENISKYGVKKRRIRPVLTKEERIKQQLRDLYETMPKYIRIATTPVVVVSKYGMKQFIPVGHTVLHRIRLVRSRFDSSNRGKLVTLKKKQQNLYGPTARITQHDTLMVLSCVWDSYEHLGYVMDVVVSKKPAFYSLVYDLIPIYASYAFGDGLADIYARYIFEVLTLSDAVFTISDATATDLRKFMEDTGIEKHVNIRTLRLGDTIPERVSDEINQIMCERFNTPFAISVGTIEARKNHVELYAALKLAVQENKINQLPHVYIIGREGWLATEVTRLLLQDPEIMKKVTVLHNVPDTELAWFYQNAQFNIYISQYEGWGLPVAESFVYGTPSIVSNVSSMVEISPKLSRFVSPFDSRQLLDAMLEYSDPDVIVAQRKRIAKIYRPTTWAETAKPILDELGRKRQVRRTHATNSKD